ncbi:unnamed protein product [Rhizoctonia solani]|uniref:F-box domain-containing protein n=1 Tax=Rhizoctonia solani TaxID=456999 RepID=A0A8H3ARA5_9AGAM|nr:unnamed protein product [Rhizoctonia solani]
MAVRLPNELLDLIAQHTTRHTQAQLSAVSRRVYYVSTRVLYASILNMDITRTTRCLLTLSKNPELARLVRFFLYVSYSHALGSFHALLTRALSNMTSLQTLWFYHDTYAPMSGIKIRTSCRLTKLVYVSESDTSYPIFQFLSTQPSIEELHISCRSDNTSTLGPEALPALRDLTAPLHLLPILLESRLSRLTRLSVLGTMSEPEAFVQLGMILEATKPPESIELVIGTHINFRTSSIIRQVITPGLALLGLRIPFIDSLRLNIHQGRIEQDQLQDMFTFALPKFSNLKTLAVMSQLPASYAHVHRDPPTWLVRMTSDTPTALPQSQVPHSEFVLTWRPLNHDALYDTSCHMQVLKSWRQVHPSLERVVFPVGAYIFID